MVLPASCPHSVVVKCYEELQTQNESNKMKVLDIPLGGGVVTNDLCIKAKKLCTPVICNHAPAWQMSCNLQGHARDLQPENQSPRVPLLCGLWLRMICVLVCLI